MTLSVNPTTMSLMSDYGTITRGCHETMTLCCCSCFASKFVPMWERFADRHCTLGEARMMEGSAADVASRRIILHLVLRYRRVMAYVASRRIILLLLCFVGRVMPYMASRRITLLLRLWPLRWTMVI